MERNRFAALALGALLLVPTASVAAASEQTFVGVYGCFLGGGSRVVEAGTEVVLTSGWGATNRGLVEAFVNGGGTHVLTIDGEVVDLTDSMTDLYLGDDGFWWVTFAYPAGPLDTGETLDVRLEIVLNHVLYDGFDRFQPGTSTFDCLVEAA